MFDAHEDKLIFLLNIVIFIQRKTKNTLFDDGVVQFNFAEKDFNEEKDPLKYFDAMTTSVKSKDSWQFSDRNASFSPQKKRTNWKYSLKYWKKEKLVGISENERGWEKKYSLISKSHNLFRCHYWTRIFLGSIKYGKKFIRKHKICKLKKKPKNH